MSTQTKSNAQIIEEMMIERAGRSPYDSGGFYGYQNDIRVKNDFTNEPTATLDEYGYRKSLYHHLVSFVEIDHEKNDSFMECVRENPDESWEDVFQMWLDKHGYKVKNKENTCNGEHCLDSNVIAYDIYYKSEDSWGSAISTHNGCDQRSGYSMPRITANMWIDLIVAPVVSIRCDRCESTLSSETGYMWCDENSVNPHGHCVNLQDIYDTQNKVYRCIHCTEGHYIP
jgi:hypothetical protein